MTRPASMITPCGCTQPPLRRRSRRAWCCAGPATIRRSGPWRRAGRCWSSPRAPPPLCPAAAPYPSARTSGAPCSTPPARTDIPWVFLSRKITRCSWISPRTALGIGSGSDLCKTPGACSSTNCLRTCAPLFSPSPPSTCRSGWPCCLRPAWDRAGCLCPPLTCWKKTIPPPAPFYPPSAAMWAAGRSGRRRRWSREPCGPICRLWS